MARGLSWEGKQSRVYYWLNAFMDVFCFLNKLFPDLRKQARQLENEIDVKLVSWSKLGSGSSPLQLDKKNGLASISCKIIGFLNFLFLERLLT